MTKFNSKTELSLVLSLLEIYNQEFEFIREVAGNKVEAHFYSDSVDPYSLLSIYINADNQVTVTVTNKEIDKKVLKDTYYFPKPITGLIKDKVLLH